MKFIRFLSFLLVLIPCVSFGAGSSDFQNASQLLMAARRGDARTMQALINAGADINYVDFNGLSLVCTAVMNNDKTAIQMLQAYGADASRCDRQIKQYRQRANVAAKGESYNFFSGLSSSHIIALSAVAVAGVIGGVALLTDAFEGSNNNSSSSSGGSHSGGGSGGGGSSSGPIQGFTVPYGPAYLASDGTVNTNINVNEKLPNWDTNSDAAIRRADFNYLRVSEPGNFIQDGLNSMLQNYLLVMGGYYSFVNGYMGQKTFRDSTTRAPLLPETGLQGLPVRVALITGNGVNPAGSADSGDGITYALSTASNADTKTVDKYVNNLLNSGVATEQTGYDFSGSGTALNPFANVNDSALAKIVAGWEGFERTYADLYGFVPNGQLAIYRTGNGKIWNTLESADRVDIGDFTDVDGSGKLSVGDTIIINGVSYTVASALAEATTITDPTVTVDETTYKLASKSKMFLAKCVTADECSDFALYEGTDGAWYVNATGGDDIDNVYLLSGNDILTYKTQVATGIYKNFEALKDAVGNIATMDVVANTNVIPASSEDNYINTKTFTTAASKAHATDLRAFYAELIDSYYGAGQGDKAHSVFNYYDNSKPMLIMPVGEVLYRDGTTGAEYLEIKDATFENYAPLLYGDNLKHNFMSIVAVSYEDGTSGVTSISGFDGASSSSGRLTLSMWVDEDGDVYRSRRCGVAGTGNTGTGVVDPWCFAASGPTAEMATASAAGAVASVMSAFPYMSNSQVFTLLALTADGPWLGTDTDGTIFTTATLVEHLRGMYVLPEEYSIPEDGSGDEYYKEYLAAFKEVYGYGLINLERATKPGKNVYFFDPNKQSIVYSSGNAYWRNASSSVFSLTGRGEITTSYYDIVESLDGSLSLPRVWTDTFSLNNVGKHGLYMGDVLGEFNVGKSNKQTSQFGNMTIDMAMSARAYNDNMNGLDNLRVAFSNEKFDLDAQYQHHFTDGESRFNGRANGVLALASNTMSSAAMYKTGNFAFGGRAFFGDVTDESLLETDPAISNQFEPGRLGWANGASFDARYNSEKLALNVSVGNMHETNTVLGSLSSGLLALSGADTQYVDAVAEYKPFENVKLSLRGTFANTRADVTGGLISGLSDIKSNAFAFGADVGGFSFTAAMPLAAVGGHMGYGYADFDVIENDGRYEVAMNNAHMEYIDLAKDKRELRFSAYYTRPVGEFTDAGVGLIYRVNPNNTDAFGNESVMMLKINHRLGI